MQRTLYVFLSVFLLAFLAQGVIWHFDTLTDESVWVERLQHAAADLRDGTFEQKDYSGHPGTAVLLPAAVLKMAGLSEMASLKITMAVWVSAAVAMVAVIGRDLFAAFPAWVGVAGMMALHPIFVRSSPTNAVVAALSALALWMVMWAEKNHALPSRWAVVLGISIGAGLATHFSLMVLVAVPSLAWLLWRLGWKPVLVSAVSAVLVWSLLDPLLWQQPKTHVLHMLQRIELHTMELGVARMSLLDLPLFAPLALLAWAVAAGVAATGVENVFPRPALFFVTALSLLIAIIFWRAQSQSIRYFFPLILFWESVLPMWIVQMTARTRRPVTAGIGVIAAFLAAQTWLLGMALV